MPRFKTLLALAFPALVFAMIMGFGSAAASAAEVRADAGYTVSVQQAQKDRLERKAKCDEALGKTIQHSTLAAAARVGFDNVAVSSDAAAVSSGAMEACEDDVATDCASLVDLCYVPEFETIMRTYCSRTCGFCG